jgi:hypothetical protein
MAGQEIHTMKRAVMTRAWEIRREYAAKHDLPVMYVMMGPCMEMAWVEVFYHTHGYRASMRKYHPDKGGKTWQAQLVNELALADKEFETLGERIAAAIIAALLARKVRNHAASM